MSPLQHLSWYWIALGAAVPGTVAVLLALPFWRARQPTFGSIVGTAVIFASAVGLILREYAEIDGLVQDCLDAGGVCWPEPSAFTRFAIYAFVALLQIFALFTIGLIVEQRIRRRDYDPQWR